MSKAAEAIDVVVPAHNEGASIGDTLRGFYSIVAVQNHIPIRFVVVLSRFVLELGDAISGISRVPSQAARSIG
jgi:hypothetical protein